MKNIFTLFLLITSISFSQDFWEPTNGPYGFGEIIEIGNGSDGKIFAVIYDVGVYKFISSNDNGENWEEISSGLFPKSYSPNSIVDLEININGDILLGTYESGIFRSTDNGNTWSEINIGFVTSENKIPLLKIIKTDINGIIYLGTVFSGIFKSSDLGNTWEEISEGLPEEIPIYSIAISPEGFIFAGTYAHGIYVSEYNGDIWWQFTDEDCGRALAIDSSGIIYGAGSAGIFRTNVLGNNWADITVSEDVNPIYMMYGIPKMEVTSGCELYYSMGFGTYYSADRGKTWLKILDHKVSCLSFASLHNVFVGYEGKVLYKNSSDDDWETKYNTTSKQSITCLAINPLDEVFAVTNQLWKSEDRGETWSIVLEDIICSLTFNDEFLFAGGSNYIYRSDHDGVNFNHIHNDLGDIQNLASNLNGDIFAVSYQDGIFRSSDNGNTWTEINKGLPIDSLFGQVAINTITVTKESLIFAGLGHSYGIFRSIDNGDSWEAVNNGLITDYQINTLFGASNGNVYSGGSGGVYMSLDDGDNWVECNKGLPLDVNVKSITEDSQGYLLVGTFKHGIYQSKDSGNNWIPMSNGLPMDDSLHKSITSITITSDGYVFVGTFENSVYRSINTNPTGITTLTIPNNYLLSQNYPNPFNPSTTIKYSIPSSSVISNPLAGERSVNTKISPLGRNDKMQVTLKVYDILGREVASLVNEKQKPGNYEVEFNCHSGVYRNLTSGVYFYKLSAGDFIQTKKMLMIK